VSASLHWTSSSGLDFTLTGRLGLSRMAALARQVELVAADDPRLAGVPGS
jgi:hypothetical protein